MSSECPHCGRSFKTTGGLFGQDAGQLRDAHAETCRENPRNRCFCGQVFANAAARDKHAVTCETNPVNRFQCPHCPQEFVSSFGMVFRTDGRALRDAHALGCNDNPANRCFCGQTFANADARNAHAVKCMSNPANSFGCQFCDNTYVTTFNVLGFCANDGRALRDAHQIVCERNPKNVCFCGRIFPNPAARERHAASCESNPANRFGCPHCDRMFVTRYGVMGIVLSDGKASRDRHESSCEHNPANSCYCGQRFASPSLRDAHAARCDRNPVNRFGCPHCSEEFVTKFGSLFTSLGSVERDAHALRCRMNPANVTCEHCGTAFSGSRGLLCMFDSDAYKRCAAHKQGCPLNPQNRCSCSRCGCGFVSRRSWFQRVEARSLRDRHQKECDVIPCTYEVVHADAGWLVLAEELEPADADKASGLAEGATKSDPLPPDLPGLPWPSRSAAREASSEAGPEALIGVAETADAVELLPAQPLDPGDFHDAESLTGSGGDEDDGAARSRPAPSDADGPWQAEGDESNETDEDVGSVTEDERDSEGSDVGGESEEETFDSQDGALDEGSAQTTIE